MTATHGFAVVGYAVRFPGAADAAEFWDVLTEGRDAVSVVPADRWDIDEFFDLDPDAVGKMVARRAGFVDDVAGFDSSLFGLSAREAMFMAHQFPARFAGPGCGRGHRVQLIVGGGAPGVPSAGRRDRDMDPVRPG